MKLIQARVRECIRNTASGMGPKNVHSAASEWLFVLQQLDSSWRCTVQPLQKSISVAAQKIPPDAV